MSSDERRTRACTRPIAALIVVALAILVAPTGDSVKTLTATSMGLRATDFVVDDVTSDGEGLPNNDSREIVAAEIVRIPIDHVGDYVWVSPPLHGVRTDSLGSVGVGFKFKGLGGVGTNWGSGTPLGFIRFDTPEGLILLVHFDIARFSGAPYLLITRAGYLHA